MKVSHQKAALLIRINPRYLIIVFFNKIMKDRISLKIKINLKKKMIKIITKIKI